MDRSASADGAEGRLAQLSFHRERTTLYARAAEDLSRWRCGAAATARRNRAGHEAHFAWRDRFGGGGERWKRGDLERSVFRCAAKPVDALPRKKYGRRLGNAAAARSGTRLGDPQTGHAGNDSEDRRGYGALQREFSG